MTYDELISTINSYIIRTDAPIPEFIRRAESQLRVMARHYLSEKTAVLSVTDNTASLPSDFMDIRQISGNLFYRPVSPINAEIYFDECGYYRQGNQLIFVGTPDSSVTILYESRFPDLTATSSNWLFERFPNVYVSAILKEFYRWEKDTDGFSIETAALNEALGIVSADDQRGRATGTIAFNQGGW